MSTEDQNRRSKARVCGSRVVGGVRNRPAETAGATISLASGLIVGLLTHDEVAAATSAAGLVPAAWTFFRLNGGVVGVLRNLLFGDGRDDTGPDAAAAATEAA